MKKRVVDAYCSIPASFELGHGPRNWGALHTRGCTWYDVCCHFSFCCWYQASGELEGNEALATFSNMPFTTRNEIDVGENEIRWAHSAHFWNLSKYTEMRMHNQVRWPSRDHYEKLSHDHLKLDCIIILWDETLKKQHFSDWWKYE